jgi:hypothetical protein
MNRGAKNFIQVKKTEDTLRVNREEDKQHSRTSGVKECISLLVMLLCSTVV